MLLFDLPKSPKDFAIKYSRGNWNSAPHLDILNEALLDLESRKINKLIVNMPPRHGKSEFISKYFSAWYLLRFPTHQIMQIAYSDSLARSFSRGVQEILLEAIEGSDFFIDPKMRSSGNFRLLPSGGGVFAAGAGGSLTGKGANLMIIDDPIKNSTEASSDNARKRLWEWFLSTAYTRLEPNGILIIVMTRWHSDDLVGKIDKKFEVIEL